MDVFEYVCVCVRVCQHEVEVELKIVQGHDLGLLVHPVRFLDTMEHKNCI